MTDAQRIAQQELETLAAIESGAVRRNRPGIPKEEAPPPAEVPPVANQESQASAKFRYELLASGMSVQEAENTVAEMEGRPPREMPTNLLKVVASNGLPPFDIATTAPAGLAGPFSIEKTLGYDPPPTPPVEPIEMTDEEWAAARLRVRRARNRVAEAKAAVAAATEELEAAETELEAAKRDVAAGAAYLTNL